MTKKILLAVVALAVAIALTAVVGNRSTAPAVPIVPAAATVSMTYGGGNTNAGGDTHGNGTGNGTYNGNDRGTGTPPTPGLDALSRAIAVRSRSVSAVVRAPAGLNVTNTTEISVLFGTRRVSQNYDRKAGTVISFDYPAGDGKRRNEVLTINLTEHAPGGAVAYHYDRLVVIEPEWEVTVSDLTFTLINDCDLVGDSDIVIYIEDESRGIEVDLSMSVGQVRHVHQLSRQIAAAKVSDNLVMPRLQFWDDDLTGFRNPVHPITDGTGTPMLPGTSKTFHFDLTDPRDDFCSAQFDYVVAKDLLTFKSL